MLMNCTDYAEWLTFIASAGSETAKVEARFGTRQSRIHEKHTCFVRTSRTVHFNNPHETDNGESMNGICFGDDEAGNWRMWIDLGDGPLYALEVPTADKNEAYRLYREHVNPMLEKHNARLALCKCGAIGTETLNDPAPDVCPACFEALIPSLFGSEVKA